MDYVYPAVFNPNGDGSYTITFPDLPGCVSEGKDLPDAMSMSSLALISWLEYLRGKDETLPAPSDMKEVVHGDEGFVNLVCARLKDGRAVKRTVSIPKWMDDRVNSEGLSLSRVLQDALSKKL
jgi:predicted RNase H-like HicB family nuclease